LGLIKYLKNQDVTRQNVYVPAIESVWQRDMYVVLFDGI